MFALRLAILISLGVSANEMPDRPSFKAYEFPKREFAVVLTEQGYFPDKLIFFAGEEISLWFTTTQEQVACLQLHGPSTSSTVLVSAKKGELHRATLKLDQPGLYSFNCPGFSFAGTAVVLGEPQQRHDTVAIPRAPASVPASSGLKPQPISEPITEQWQSQWKPRAE